MAGGRRRHGPLTPRRTIARFEPRRRWEKPRGPESQSIFGRGRLFLLTFLCPFLNPSGTERRGAGKRLRGESKGKQWEQCKWGCSQCRWETITTRREENTASSLKAEIKKRAEEQRSMWEKSESSQRTFL